MGFEGQQEVLHACVPPQSQSGKGNDINDNGLPYGLPPLQPIAQALLQLCVGFSSTLTRRVSKFYSVSRVEWACTRFCRLRRGLPGLHATRLQTLDEFVQKPIRYRYATSEAVLIAMQAARFDVSAFNMLQWCTQAQRLAEARDCVWVCLLAEFNIVLCCGYECIFSKTLLKRLLCIQHGLK